MRTLIVQSVHLRTEEQARLFTVSHALIRKLNPDADLLVMDNASPVDPMQCLPGKWQHYGLEPMSDDVPFITRPRSVVRFAEAIGHFQYGGTMDGPGRAYMRALEIAMASGYDRFCYIESDCLVSLPAEWWFDRMKKPVAGSAPNIPGSGYLSSKVGGTIAALAASPPPTCSK